MREQWGDGRKQHKNHSEREKRKQHMCIRWTQISQRTVMFWVLEPWILHCLAVNVACQRLLFSPFIHALYGQGWNSRPVQWETWNSDSLLQEHLNWATVSWWKLYTASWNPENKVEPESCDICKGWSGKGSQSRNLKHNIWCEKKKLKKNTNLG